MASRMALFTGCMLNYIGLIALLLSTVESAKYVGDSTWDYIKDAGSVSSLYAMSGGGYADRASTTLFDAFLSAGAILIIFSNFGFYIMPR